MAMSWNIFCHRPVTSDRLTIGLHAVPGNYHLLLLIERPSVTVKSHSICPSQYVHAISLSLLDCGLPSDCNLCERLIIAEAGRAT